MKNYRKKFLGTFLACIFVSLIIKSVINTTIITNLSVKNTGDKILNEDTPQLADPFEPPPDPDNDKFQWNFSSGSQLGFIYERYNTTFYDIGLHYFNITSQPYIYIDEPMMFITNYSYCVQLEEIYYNLTQKKIVTLPNSPLLNVSCINFTTPLMMGGTGFLLPMLPPSGGGGGPSPGWFFMYINPFIPMNDTTLALDWSVERLKLWYEMFMGMGPFNIESVTTAPQNNNIYFENTGTGAFVNLTYYDNGTLLYGEVYSYDEDDGWWTITLTTIFDVNPLDNLEWDVEVGDNLYFGIERREYKFTITSIYNLSYYYAPANLVITVQIVNASLSVWIPQFEIWYDFNMNMTIGVGNEQFPAVFLPQHVLAFRMPFLLPEGYSLKRLAMIYKAISGTYWDQVTFGDSWLKIYNSATGGYTIYEFAKNGSALIFEAHNMEMWGELYAGLYRKNITTINGFNSIDIYPLSLSGFNVTLNISVTDDTLLYHSAFGINPINTNKGIGNYGVLFIDVMVNETGNLDQTNFTPINITIEFDPTTYKYVYIYYFNTTSEKADEAWQPLSYVTLGSGRIMFTVEHTSIFVFTNIPPSLIRGLIGGDDDDDDDDDEAQIIPIGNYYLIFLALAVIGLIIYKKREIFKKIK